MATKFEYKISQTINGKTRIKEGLIISESSSSATRDLSEKIRFNAESWGIVCKKYVANPENVT